MLKGAELILTPNCCNLDEFRLEQFKVRAVENIVHVAMAQLSAALPERSLRRLQCLGATVWFWLGRRKESSWLPSTWRSCVPGRVKSIWGNAYRRPHRYRALVSPEKESIWQRTDGYGRPWNAQER